MKKALIYSLIILRICYSANAQVYTEKQTQHRFAQTYFGLNTQIVPSQGSLLWSNHAHTLPSMISPRFTIGGLHFWGKWDFKINIPLARFYDEQITQNTEVNFNPGGDLSARYYPWRIIYGKLRPYAGISVNEMTFGIKSKEMGNRSDLFITTSLLAGVSIAKNDWQINAEVMYLPKNSRDFYTSRSEIQQIELPNTYFSVGLIKYIEGTLHIEENKNSGLNDKVEKILRSKNKLNSLSIGMAPSGSYFINAPSYDQADRRSVPRQKGDFNWEYGLGYLFYDAGIHLGISYRDYTTSRESYGLEHLYRRNSIAAEALFFIWDYNGFVPFIGPSISYERWAAGEFESDVQIGSTRRTKMISPGIIFGWDIVPSSIETWVLRTNLRYYPFQKIENVEGKKSRVDQFEFNFIELVLYPSRIVNVSRARKKH